MITVVVLAAGAYAVDWQAGPSDDVARRQQTVAERGVLVMPFDLDATTHVFEPTQAGGTQSVVADDPRDGAQITLIRRHLEQEVAAFSKGDFGDPAAIHGHDMPGLAVLESNADELTITYRDFPAGGEVKYRTDDAVVVRALHDWFEAQTMDHGDHARTP